MNNKLTQNGLAGKVYWQDQNLIHAEDQWIPFGERTANGLEMLIRRAANDWNMDKAVCPACYMLTLYNAAVFMAERNDQSMKELGESMAQLFTELATGKVPSQSEMVVFPHRNALEVHACPPGSACPTPVINAPEAPYDEALDGG